MITLKHSTQSAGTYSTQSAGIVGIQKPISNLSDEEQEKILVARQKELMIDNPYLFPRATYEEIHRLMKEEAKKPLSKFTYSNILYILLVSSILYLVLIILACLFF